MRNNKALFIFLILLVAMLCTACNFYKEDDNEIESWHHPVDRSTTADDSDKKSTGLFVITEISSNNKSVSVRSIDDYTDHVYSYNTATEFLSRHNVAITPAQVAPGDVVDAKFDAKTNILSQVKISDADRVWENTKVTNFAIDTKSKSMRIGNSLYSYDNYILAFSDAEQIELSEICQADQLIVRGVDRSVVSIVVDKGHGYVDLSGDTLFIGGYVDIGSEVVKVIEEDMLILVREGTYKVEVRNDQYLAEKEVTVKKNQKVTVDFSDVRPIVIETGSVKIAVEPKDAIVYIDGVKTDCSEVFSMKTGKHKIEIVADNYEKYTGTFEVEKGLKTFEYKLKGIEKETTTESSSTAPNETTSQEETTAQAPTETEAGSESETNTVSVNGPEGGYVYFDGKYKGIAPVTFPMITGEHVISIVNDGDIKSYTVNLADGADNVRYDFSPKE